MALFYTNNFENNKLYYVAFFIFITLLNKQSLKVNKNKSQILKLMIFSLIPLFIYLIITFIIRANNSFKYMNLIYIPIIFNIYQIFKSFRFGVVKK